MSTTTTQVTDTKPEVTKVTDKQPEVKRIDDFGAGRYSTFMGQVFKGCKSLFNLSEKVSAKIARDAGSDIGSAMKYAADAKVSLGKVSKAGTITVKDAASVKGVYVTNPIMMARSIQWIDEAGKNGVSYGNTEWKLIPTLQVYIDDLQKELDPVSVPSEASPVSVPSVSVPVSQ